MTDQLSFPGFDRVPKPIDQRFPTARRFFTNRLFFAIFPVYGVATRIAQLAQRMRSDYGLTGLPLGTVRFHVSLYGFGNYERLPEAVVADAKAVATSVTAQAFDVVFDRAMSFRSRRAQRPLVLRGDEGVAALKAFHQILCAAMARAGFGDQTQRYFTPHATLLYDNRSVPEHDIEPISWTVREFVLVRSLHGQSRYVQLMKWPLRG